MCFVSIRGQCQYRLHHVPLEEGLYYDRAVRLQTWSQGNMSALNLIPSLTSILMHNNRDLMLDPNTKRKNPRNDY